MSDASRLVQAGDEVRVISLFGEESPPAGWPATVTAVRDDEYDVRCTFGAELRPHPVTFALADNRSTDTGGQFIMLTPGVAERRGRRFAALSVLHEHGIELTSLAPGHSLTLEQIEDLAKVAGTFTEQEG
jgi:hypothetical protein